MNTINKDHYYEVGWQFIDAPKTQTFDTLEAAEKFADIMSQSTGLNELQKSYYKPKVWINKVTIEPIKSLRIGWK